MDDVENVGAVAVQVDDGARTHTVRPRLKDRARSAWAGVRAAVGGLLGLLPHILHHVGIVAGTALLAGVWGNLALYLVGLLLSIPLLRRLRRRFGSPLAPVAGAAVFTVLFLFSALVLGPAISRTPVDEPAPVTSPTATDEHAGHHP